MSIYDNLIVGLQEAIDYEKGLPTNVKTQKRVKKISSPIVNYSKDDIKNIRNNTGLTQKVFANALGVSVKTVEAWETGTNSPQGSSVRLLQCIENNNQFLEQYNFVLESSII